MLPQIDAGNGRVEIHDMDKMLGIIWDSYARTSPREERDPLP
jgi:hypothetical protein